MNNFINTTGILSNLKKASEKEEKEERVPLMKAQKRRWK